MAQEVSSAATNGTSALSETLAPQALKSGDLLADSPWRRPRLAVATSAHMSRHPTVAARFEPVVRLWFDHIIHSHFMSCLLTCFATRLRESRHLGSRNLLEMDMH